MPTMHDPLRLRCRLATKPSSPIRTTSTRRWPLMRQSPYANRREVFRHTTQAYDAVSNATQLIAGDGSSVVTTYDPDNNQEDQYWYDAMKQPRRHQNRKYDDDGRLTEASNATAPIVSATTRRGSSRKSSNPLASRFTMPTTASAIKRRSPIPSAHADLYL